MKDNNLNDILSKVKYNEKRAKKRALVFTIIPIVVAIVLITYTSAKIYQAQEDLNAIKRKITKIKSLNDSLRRQNNSLSDSLKKSIVTLGKAVSVTTEINKFIDKEMPYYRSLNETRFYINQRMLNDKIRGNYVTLSETVSKLPQLDDNKNWIVIVETSASLEDIKKDAPNLISIYGRDQVVIYKDTKESYALGIKGNGTFTRAYRLNVELRDKYGYIGAYFSPSLNWGSNYL